MNEVALLKMAHLLCLVYWLGADLGVFYSSFFVVDDNKSAEVRMAAAKILFALDLAPRVCMTLMIPTGLNLGFAMGLLKVPMPVVIATWTICLAWLAMVLFLHFASRARDLSFLTKTDFRFRFVVIAVLVAFAVYALTSETRVAPDYISYKLIILALMVLCGLMIRLKLRVFSPAFSNLAKGPLSGADRRDIRTSMVSTRPYVIAIWFGILVNMALSLRLF